jgi:hypothetical protein
LTCVLVSTNVKGIFVNYYIFIKSYNMKIWVKIDSDQWLLPNFFNRIYINILILKFSGQQIWKSNFEDCYIHYLVSKLVLSDLLLVMVIMSVLTFKNLAKVIGPNQFSLAVRHRTTAKVDDWCRDLENWCHCFYHIGTIIMCLTSYWLIIFSIRVSWFIWTI